MTSDQLPCTLLVDNGSYRPQSTLSLRRIAAGVTRAALVVPIVSILFQFFFIRWEFSRNLVLLLSAISYITVLILRLGFFRIQRHIPKPISRQREPTRRESEMR